MRSLHHYVAEQRFAEYRAVADVSGRQEVDGSIPFVSTICNIHRIPGLGIPALRGSAVKPMAESV